jgi:predicted nucleic acid-binding protein
VELSSPSWITTREGLSEARRPRSRRSGEEDLTRLDSGERDAILLAEREDARLLLIDERAGRDAARNRGLTVTGTIGVLRAAVKEGHVDAAPVAKVLRDTTFRASFDLYRWLLDQQE